MIEILTVFNARTIFANGGQAVAERLLVRALAETGRARVRVVLWAGDDDDLERIYEDYKDLVAAGLVEFLPPGYKVTGEDLRSCTGVMFHGRPYTLLRYRLLNRVPVFLHLHSVELSVADRLVFPWSFKGWEGRVPFVVVAPSECTKRRVGLARETVDEGAGWMPHIAVVPHGINPELVTGGDRKQGRRLAGLPEKARVLLSLNRISPHKGDFAQLLHVFAILSARREWNSKTLYLCLAGGVADKDRDYVAQLSALAGQLGIKPQVRLQENLPEQDKKHLFAAADAFVSLATHPQESFGIVLLEAMAAALPVVATDWNGYPEVLPAPYRRWLVPTVSSHSLARRLDWTGTQASLSQASAAGFEALVAALADALTPTASLRETCELGRRYALKHTWAATAQALLALWERPPPGEFLEEDGRGEELKSPVDGLASRFLCNEDKLIARPERAAQPVVSWAGKELQPAAAQCWDELQTLCASPGRSLGEVGGEVLLTEANLHHLVMAQMRAGVLEFA